MIHLELKTRKVVFISDTDILGGTDSPKEAKEKEINSGGKMKINDYFGSKYRKESELCIQNLSQCISLTSST